MLFMLMATMFVMHMIMVAFSVMFVMMVVAVVVATAGAISRVFMVVMTSHRKQIERSATSAERHGARAHQA